MDINQGLDWTGLHWMPRQTSGAVLQIANADKIFIIP